MTRFLQYTIGISGLVFALGSAPGLAKPGKGGDRQGPPAEAITACEGQAEGSAVSFSTPRGDTVAGVCRVHNDQLFAVPDNHRGGGRMDSPGQTEGGAQ